MIDLQPQIPNLASDAGFARPLSTAFRGAGLAGENRLSTGEDRPVIGVDRLWGSESTKNGHGNTWITGPQAHAAVRMHAYPVSMDFQAFCPKAKTPHFQRWKVAN